MKMMTMTDKLLNGYDNMKLLHYDDKSIEGNLVTYDDLTNTYVPGVLIANFHNEEGKLMQLYSKSHDTHSLCLAASGLGKTTSIVIPQIISYAKQKIKRNIFITDPKGEIFKNCSQTLRNEGYDVKVLNLRDYRLSEAWNPLTTIFRKYRRAEGICKEVKLVSTTDGYRNSFLGEIYNDQKKLDMDLEREKNILLEEVGCDIDDYAQIAVNYESKDEYWCMAARTLFKALIWAMLEDSNLEDNPITEENCSINTIFNVMDIMLVDDSEDPVFNDRGYFTKRSKDSRAYRLAKGVLLYNAPRTRRCILSTLGDAISMYRNTAIRALTKCNSFEIKELVNKGPTAFFVVFPDESKTSYAFISQFLQLFYKTLIEEANRNEDGKLTVPFVFILDEFGNMPKMTDFEVAISACRSRNIFFSIVLQSYAQLNNVYGSAVAEIVKDNINVRQFLGSNNSLTLDAFSKECGTQTRISPLSVLNGENANMEQFQIESIPLIPKSALTKLEVGDCIVTEANSGHVLYSKMERYFLCDEFKNLPLSKESDYRCAVNIFDKKYDYKLNRRTRGWMN